MVDLEEALKKAEESRKLAIANAKNGYEGHFVNRSTMCFTAAVYYTLEAVYHQNQAIIELLKQKK